MAFFDDVYRVVKQIPRGKVTTYGQIARILGQPTKSKIVGWALHSNPEPGVIPCHRVVNRRGELSGSFAFGGLEVQKKLLQDEGIIFDQSGIIDLEKYLWKPEQGEPN
ncbi:MAG: MGMT family protein [Clostridia bacterium]|nr:MGMT family protein [Clostridia bacterium]